MATPSSTTKSSNDKMLLTPDNVYLFCRDFECAIVQESDALRPSMAKTLGAPLPTIAGSKMLCVPQRVFMLQVLLLINTLVTSLWDDVPEFVMPEDAEATFMHSLTMQAMAKRTTRPIRPHFDRA
ncbi:hypothetical protein PINS_up023206 [Pythium insidiosum]|nr:hypothetical protein PINS_up013831 [Pythium insidiosum]GLE10934.1 hypothetical protein PINS_up023206 [Pythium insidiosum]